MKWRRGKSLRDEKLSALAHEKTTLAGRYFKPASANDDTTHTTLSTPQRQSRC